MLDLQELTLDISQAIEIKAAVGDAYSALVRQLTSENASPHNDPMPMVLEEWPGGRWFRDLGNGQGHLWGLVQVIKPPTLIEIQGPLFMSYAVAGHVQFRVTQVAGGCELSMRHRAIGMVEEAHREGLVPGWQFKLEATKKMAEQ